LAAREVGTSHTLTARFSNVGVPAGTAVSFLVTGVHTQSAIVTADTNGQASFRYTASSEGVDQVVAIATINGQSVTSNPATVMWVATASDSTPPTTTATATPVANAFGWNNTDVTIQLTAVDNPGGSG